MRGYRAPPGPRVVMVDIPPVTGVAGLEARLKARGVRRNSPYFISLSDCEGGLRTIHNRWIGSVKPHVVNCLGVAGLLTIGPRETTLTAAGVAILAEIDARRGGR